MYKINWDNPFKISKSGLIIDVGDIRLLLKEHSDCWQLNMGIRTYTNDKEHSMVRPPVNVARFSKPCDIEEAKNLTEEYLNDFLSSILNAIM